MEFQRDLLHVCVDKGMAWVGIGELLRPLLPVEYSRPNPKPSILNSKLCRNLDNAKDHMIKDIVERTGRGFCEDDLYEELYSKNGWSSFDYSLSHLLTSHLVFDKRGRVGEGTLPARNPSSTIAFSLGSRNGKSSKRPIIS